MSSAQTKVATPRFTLLWVIDGRLEMDEQVWDQEHLRERLATVLVNPDHEVSWGVMGSDLRVDVERRDGMVLSWWRCLKCDAPETCWDSQPTAEMVIGKLTSHVCIEGSVTAPAGDATESLADAVADVLADDEDEDEAWEELPSVPVGADHAKQAAELEALEAGEAAEVGAGFFDSLVLVDAMGVAL